MFHSPILFSLLVPIVNIYDSGVVVWEGQLPNERVNDTSEALNVFSTCEIDLFFGENLFSSCELIIFKFMSLTHEAVFIHSLGFNRFPFRIFAVDNNLDRQVLYEL